MPEPASTPGPRLAVVQVAAFWAAYLVILWLAAFLKAIAPAPWSELAWGLAAASAILGLTFLLARRDHRSLHDLGIAVRRGSAARFLVGCAIGTATYALTILAVSLLITPVHLAAATPPSPGAMLLTIATVLLLAAMEELGFRGYPLRTLLTAYGAWRAQTLVAVAFALCHILFGWDWQRVVFGVLPSALLFGAAAQVSGGLAMPTGIHAALNLARVATGETASPGLWTVAIAERATGALIRWAPLIGLVVTLLVTAAVWLWPRRPGRLAVAATGT